MTNFKNLTATQADPVCPNCGSDLVGDGYTSVVHCEHAEEDTYCNHEPDAGPVYCTYDPYDERGHHG